MASDAGLAPLAGPRDMAKARAALRDAGYRGEPVVLMVPSTSSSSFIMGTVAADTLKQAGMNVEVYAVEFNAMLQRRNRKGPVSDGGWSAFITNWAGIDWLNPAVHIALRGAGEAGYPGWATMPRLEALRAQWFDGGRHRGAGGDLPRDPARSDARGALLPARPVHPADRAPREPHRPARRLRNLLEREARMNDAAAGSAPNAAVRGAALDWIAANERRLSEFNARIWSHAEPAWREYRSARDYVELLRAEGFAVEEGSGGMPTAFAASGRRARAGRCWRASPSTTRCPATRSRSCRARRRARGCTPTPPATPTRIPCSAPPPSRPCSARRAAMEAHGVPGTLKLFGEPAEKVCGSKPIHAAKGYYDGLDAAVVWHPWPYNTVTARRISAPTGAR